MAKRKRNTKTKSNHDNNTKKAEVTNEVKHGSDNANDNVNDEEPWSKSKKKRMRKLMARNNRNEENKQTKDGDTNQKKGHARNNNKYNNNSKSNDKKEETTLANQANTATDGNILNLNQTTKRPMSALQQKFLSRLAGSRFRELNEELYTTDSSSALQRFQEKPELFEQYHDGFRTQVKSWPVNPIDVIYRWIISTYRKQKHDLVKGKGKQAKQLRIADFGCGDAKLAEKLLKFQPNEKTSKKSKGSNKGSEAKGNGCPFKVHSFDLVANGNKLITPCDMSNVPLKNGSVDIGVFVLALMGTNIADFIREAHRVLSPAGVLKIAEVRSRFESANEYVEGGKEETTKGKKQKQKQSKQNFNYSKKNSDDTMMNDFLDVMEDLGFHCVKKDRQNKMFFILEFEKTGVKPSKQASFTAKPCIYKRR